MIDTFALAGQPRQRRNARNPAAVQGFPCSGQRASPAAKARAVLCLRVGPFFPDLDRLEDRLDRVSMSGTVIHFIGEW